MKNLRDNFVCFFCLCSLLNSRLFLMHSHDIKHINNFKIECNWTLHAVRARPYGWVRHHLHTMAGHRVLQLLMSLVYAWISRFKFLYIIADLITLAAPITRRIWLQKPVNIHELSLFLMNNSVFIWKFC